MWRLFRNIRLPDQSNYRIIIIIIILILLNLSAVISGDIEIIHICSMQTLHWCPARLSAWHTSLLPLYAVSTLKNQVSACLADISSWTRSRTPCCCVFLEHLPVNIFVISLHHTIFKKKKTHKTTNKQPSCSFGQPTLLLLQLPPLEHEKKMDISIHEDHTGARSACCHLETGLLHLLSTVDALI